MKFSEPQKPKDTLCVALAVRNYLAYEHRKLPSDLQADVDIALASTGHGIPARVYEPIFQLIGLRECTKEDCVTGLVLENRHMYVVLMKTKEHGYFCLNRDGRHGWFPDINGRYWR